LRALRANARAARGVGIAARPLQLLALVASAFVTSVVGSFVAQYRLRVDPAAMFGLALSFDIALLGCIAGPRWAWGPPIAALAYVLLGAIVPLHPPGAIGAAVLVVEGLLIVALARFRPDGAFAAPVRRVGSTPSAGSLA
jgi:branched-chain amino acid transport system permease protein